jgi:hypothetical protein
MNSDPQFLRQLIFTVHTSGQDFWWMISDHVLNSKLIKVTAAAVGEAGKTIGDKAGGVLQSSSWMMSPFNGDHYLAKGYPSPRALTGQAMVSIH